MASPKKEESPTGSTVREFKLKEDNELRFEVASEDVAVELCSGRAEIFGTELKENEKYTFLPGMRVAVFSWTGATIEISGEAHNAYIAENNHPMILYLNTHAGLEQTRRKALADKTGKTRGPRTMLVGPTDVGKSTVCRILTNYAVRLGHTPIFVDVDVGQGIISVAGTIGAIMVERTADPVYGFDCRNAKIFQLGSTSPGTNIPLYDHLVGELAAVVNRECDQNSDLNKSGVIINTCGWVNGAGYKSLVNVAECFEVDVVVVLDHERLYTELKRDLPSFVKIVHHPKSGGVETRSSATRIDNRRKSFHKYFYGTRQLSFTPFRNIITFDDLIFAKIGADRLPESCLPYGMKAEDHRMMVVRLDPSPKFNNHVVAIAPPEYTTVDQTLLSAMAVGFIVIIDVNVENRQISITSPQAHFPEGSTIGLLADITFTDDEVRVH
uniref:Protein CLP1 homolog n=1 Tax=Steinernema glaseri TaxID=37863 RepID=A0A1I8AXI1_9BILA